MASPDLVWMLVKDQNRFLKKGINGVTFSTEPGNLFNRNSYKYSGLANAKTVHVEASRAAPLAVSIAKKSTAAAKPAKSVRASISKKSVRQQLKSVAKDIALYRPDLKHAALARVSAINKSLRVKKFGKAKK